MVASSRRLRTAVSELSGQRRAVGRMEGWVGNTQAEATWTGSLEPAADPLVLLMISHQRSWEGIGGMRDWRLLRTFLSRPASSTPEGVTRSDRGLLTRRRRWVDGLSGCKTAQRMRDPPAQSLLLTRKIRIRLRVMAGPELGRELAYRAAESACAPQSKASSSAKLSLVGRGQNGASGLGLPHSPVRL